MWRQTIWKLLVWNRRGYREIRTTRVGETLRRLFRLFPKETDLTKTNVDWARAFATDTIPNERFGGNRNGDWVRIGGNIIFIRVCPAAATTILDPVACGAWRFSSGPVARASRPDDLTDSNTGCACEPVGYLFLLFSKKPTFRRANAGFCLFVSWFFFEKCLYHLFPWKLHRLTERPDWFTSPSKAIHTVRYLRKSVKILLSSGGGGRKYRSRFIWDTNETYFQSISMNFVKKKNFFI